MVVGGVAALGSLVSFPVRAHGGAEALLLSCMDYRLVDDIVHYMDGRGMTNKYDHIILAGASLGAVSKSLGWAQTFWKHLDVAINLHHIHKVIILDHKDCGAYRLVLKKSLTGEAEMEAHRKEMHILEAAVKKRKPGLEVEKLMMDLEGNVVAVS